VDDLKAIVVHNGQIPQKDLGGGVSRKVLSYTPEIMMVEVRFDKGGVGAVHTHPHVQSTYVKSGSFRFTIDGEDAIVSEGDTIAFPSNIPHGTVCLEPGILVDVFTPMRADFV
jgi:quercetin dioxygenase-like cupin family protein